MGSKADLVILSKSSRALSEGIPFLYGLSSMIAVKTSATAMILEPKGRSTAVRWKG